jgi:hypothetical protein
VLSAYRPGTGRGKLARRNHNGATFSPHEELSDELVGDGVAVEASREEPLAEEAREEGSSVPFRHGEEAAVRAKPPSVVMRMEMRVPLPLAGQQPRPWGVFRDVVELNGRKLENHEGRLERLFASLPGVEVEFRDVASPTLVRDERQDRDVPSRGRFWIDPTSGAVLRSEIQYVGRGFVSTEYRPEPGFDVLVPGVMQETSGFKATARYAKYRRFEVATDGTVAKEPDMRHDPSP